MDINKAKVLSTIKSWTLSEVREFLVKNNLQDYVKFAEDKHLNGFSLLTLSEGIIAVWRQKVDLNMLICIIQDVKINPHNYYDVTSNEIIDNRFKAHKEATAENVIKRKQKPTVPKRVDSLRREINFDVSDDKFTKEATVGPKLNINYVNAETDNLDQNFVNLENMIAPKSFLYSDKLINTVSKLYPYLPMKMSQDDVILRKKTPLILGNKIYTESKIIFQDAGYYEMTSRKSLNHGRRHSDGGINTTDGNNTYEELFFKSKIGDKSTDKKRFGLLKMVLRKPTFRWERFNTKNNSQKSEDETTNSANHTSRLQRLNEMVVRKLSPKISYNYKIKNVLKINENHTQSQIKTVKFKQFIEDQDNKEKKCENEIIISEPNEKLEDVLLNSGAQYEEPKFKEDNEADQDLTVNEHFYEEADPLEGVFLEEETTIDVRDSDSNSRIPIEVEDYLEPIQFFNVPTAETVMDNLADEIIKLFDKSMEATDANADQAMFSKEEQSTIETNFKPQVHPKPNVMINNTNNVINNNQIPVPLARLPKPKVPIRTLINKNNNTIAGQINKIKESIDEENCDKMNEHTSNDRPFETLQKWNESLKNNANKRKEAVRRSMIDRPLPVPVENEFYYMEVGRKEAEDLLEGHADGTFILRPSSQSNHIYTITLIYQGSVYNIGCRRRQDGRLALGFSKPGEQNFLTIDQLIQHYYTERLLLIQDGVKVGSTTLRKLDGT